MEKKLNVMTNIAILFVAIIGIVVLKDDLVMRRSLAARGPDPATLVGKKFPLAFGWEGDRKNVVLALSVGCHYCTASAGFYQQLTSYARAHNVGVTALFPQSDSESVPYLEKLGVQIGTIHRAEFNDISVSGTPTLFVIDATGKVVKVWKGQLQPGEQKKVLDLLG